MAKYFAGTRSLLSLPGLGIVRWNTVAGRFDPLYVPGGVQLDDNAFVDIPIAIDATSVTTLWGHFDFFHQSISPSGSAEPVLLVFINTSNFVVARFIATTNTSVIRFQFWAGTAYVDAGVPILINTNVINAIDFRIVCGATGSFQFWRNGFNLISVTGLSAAVNNIAVVRLISNTSLDTVFSQVALSDFDMRQWKFPSDIPTTAGTYNEGAGTLVDMGDRNLNTSYILPTNGTRVTGASAARTLPPGLDMRSVHVNGTMRVSSPVANARHMLRVGSTDFQSPNLAPALTSEYELRGFYWDTNPATSSVWNISDYNSAQKGHVAIT